jgi:hypothetical protein
MLRRRPTTSRKPRIRQLRSHKHEPSAALESESLCESSGEIEKEAAELWYVKLAHGPQEVIHSVLVSSSPLRIKPSQAICKVRWTTWYNSSSESPQPPLLQKLHAPLPTLHQPPTTSQHSTVLIHPPTTPSTFYYPTHIHYPHPHHIIYLYYLLPSFTSIITTTSFVVPHSTSSTYTLRRPTTGSKADYSSSRAS